MSQETINLAVGAFIGFLVSIITTLVAHILETRNKTLARKWELEDKRRQKIHEDIESFEEWITECYRFAWEVYMFASTVSTLNRDELIDEIEKIDSARVFL